MKCSIFLSVIIAVFLTYSQTANSRGKSFQVEGVAQEAIGLANELVEKENEYAAEKNAELAAETKQKIEFDNSYEGQQQKKIEAGERNDSSDEACKKNKNECWMIMKEKGERITIKCLAGIRTGEQHTLYLNSKGKWQTDHLFFDTSDSSFDKAAMYQCNP
ncbi:MAG: hypothetical protein QX189_02305 [Methylococcales bacterium]